MPVPADWNLHKRGIRSWLHPVTPPSQKKRNLSVVGKEWRRLKLFIRNESIGRRYECYSIIARKSLHKRRKKKGLELWRTRSFLSASLIRNAQLPPIPAAKGYTWRNNDILGKPRRLAYKPVNKVNGERMFWRAAPNGNNAPEEEKEEFPFRRVMTINNLNSHAGAKEKDKGKKETRRRQ